MEAGDRSAKGVMPKIKAAGAAPTGCREPKQAQHLQHEEASEGGTVSDVCVTPARYRREQVDDRAHRVLRDERAAEDKEGERGVGAGRVFHGGVPRQLPIGEHPDVAREADTPPRPDTLRTGAGLGGKECVSRWKIAGSRGP